jgi:D-sedoheptulose 7-phosphate isomerase/D-glycero-D-manno-heptose 1,7-bisphosphate phosphatase
VSRPGVLLDRDGTIIVDHGYVGSVDRVEFIDGAIEAVAALNRAGIPIAVVTNQSGVARGYYGVEDVEVVHKHIAAELALRGAHIDLWLSCPYHPDGTVTTYARVSADRKPAPGMALAAAAALDLDLSASWVIGDRAADIGLARAVGARPLYVGPSTDVPGVDCFPDLAAAVEFLLGQENVRGESAVPRVAPRFPEYRFPHADSFGTAYVAELARAMRTIDPASLQAAADLLAAAYQRDAAVFACGNGGSASIANHMQCDHVKGIRNGTGISARVSSLSTNMELFSAIANDLGFDAVFEYQLQALARPGDVLVVVSSSGRSPNIVRALEWANAHGMQTIALTGFEGGPANRTAMVSIHVDAANYGVVEDAHQACMHLLAQFIRQSRMPADDVVAGVF